MDKKEMMRMSEKEIMRALEEVREQIVGVEHVINDSRDFLEELKDQRELLERLLKLSIDC